MIKQKWSKYPFKECGMHFVRQPEQLGLGHAVLCTERVVGNDPFAFLADDFLISDGDGVTAELVRLLKNLVKHNYASWK